MSELGTLSRVFARRQVLLKRQSMCSTRAVPHLLPRTKKQGAIFPPSFVAQHLWFLDQRGPELLVSQVPGARHLPERAGLAASASVLRAPGCEHKTVRTASGARGREPWWRVMSAWVSPLRLPLNPSYRQQEAHLLPVQKTRRPSRPSENRLSTRERWQPALKERLPEYMLPLAFSFLGAGPLTLFGAIFRQEQVCCRPLRGRDWQISCVPCNALVLQMVRLWLVGAPAGRRLARRPPLSPDDYAATYQSSLVPILAVPGSQLSLYSRSVYHQRSVLSGGSVPSFAGACRAPARLPVGEQVSRQRFLRRLFSMCRTCTAVLCLATDHRSLMCGGASDGGDEQAGV
jgi:hypothetical protein